MHYAVSHQTAPENIYKSLDSEKEHMGLTTWKNSPNRKILPKDVVIAKNYLTKEELESLERIVSAFLDLADDRDILKDAGTISHEIACDKALTEFEKYRIKQDKLFESDFDKFMIDTKNIKVDSE